MLRAPAHVEANIEQFFGRSLRRRGSVAAAAVQRQTLDDKRRLFAEDFAGGRIGARFNTFEHRSRILRQLAAKISEMPRNNEEKRLVSFVSHRRI